MGVITLPPIGEHGVLWWACVSVCVCLSVHNHISGTTHPIFTKFFMHVTYGHGLVLLRQHSYMLRISSFVDDVIFADKLIGYSTSPPVWGREALRYAALSLVHRNTRCRQWTLGTTSFSQGLLGCSGHVEYSWHHVCTVMYLHICRQENDVCLK